VEAGAEPARDARALIKKYGRTVVVDRVTLRVERGRVHGLLGPNGSGESTCLHMIAGLLAPDSGHIALDGVPVRSKDSRQALGFAPDDLPLPAALTGREYLVLHDALRARDDLQAALDIVAVFSMERHLERPIAEYSHGMQRKLQLAAAIMHRPALLVLDEPYRGLDPESSAVLRSIIEAYARTGHAVLVATHDMLRAERDCDAVSIIDNGTVRAAGAPATLIAERERCSTLEDVFLEVTGRAADARRTIAWAETAFSMPRKENR
jgi:ABC-2 type transport system ATP-binding protein